MNYSNYNNEKSTFDYFTIILYFLIVIFGAINIYSANSGLDFESPFSMKTEHGKQVLFIAIAGILVFFILLSDHKVFRFSAYGIYLVVLLLLLVVFALAVATKGAQSWIKIGSFKLQPSEFAKYATSLALAKYLSAYGVKFKDKHVWISIGIFAVPMLLTLLQNDTGSALVFTVFFLVLFREGMSGWWLLLGLYLVVLFVFTIIFPSHYIILTTLFVIAGLIYYFRKKRNLVYLLIGVFLATSIFVFSVDFLFSKVLQPHQQQRILVTLNQEVDEYYQNKKNHFSFFKIEQKKDDKKSKRDYSYNVRQSKISIGAGRWTGNGFNKGTQTKAKLVPEQHTDFIFCTVGEEYGFLGSSLFIIAYCLFIGRIYYLAERQKNSFSRIYGYCVASIFLFHFFINIGMAMGLLPVIGIPLPLMSYGGSSLFSFSIMLFTFLKLDANRINEL